MVNSTQFVVQENLIDTILQGTALGPGSSGGPVWITGAGGHEILAGVISAASGMTGYFAEITSGIFNENPQLVE